MAVSDELGLRMKNYYEFIPRSKLMRRTPVAIRIDGKAFHTFTKGFEKPFDELLVRAMQQTTKYLCENIMGCVLGYTQSDEITLILCDYQTLHTDAWFDYEVQKLCSVSASMATLAFNRIFDQLVEEENLEFTTEFLQDGELNPNYKNKELRELWYTHRRALEKGAMFDARCFNIPKEEVTNLIYWRQLDATRNSIQMVGHANFSQKELHGKSCNEIQDMLMLERGINWNDFPVALKRGSCVIKEYPANIKDFSTAYKEWVIDTNIPIFKGDDRNYIEERIYFDEGDQLC